MGGGDKQITVVLCSLLLSVFTVFHKCYGMFRVRASLDWERTEKTDAVPCRGHSWCTVLSPRCWAMGWGGGGGGITKDILVAADADLPDEMNNTVWAIDTTEGPCARWHLKETMVSGMLCERLLPVQFVNIVSNHRLWLFSLWTVCPAESRVPFVPCGCAHVPCQGSCPTGVVRTLMSSTLSCCTGRG